MGALFTPSPMTLCESVATDRETATTVQCRIGALTPPGLPLSNLRWYAFRQMLHCFRRDVPFGMLKAVVALSLALAAPAAAHEHMYIGSDHPRGGRLVLRYDFTRKFPLVPAPGGGYIGTDPAFNAQVTDDPTDGIYRLKGGTRVKMEITAMDPEVLVNFNGVKMTAPGDKAKIGRMPYLHQHPQWMLHLPPGVFGDYHLSFRVTAHGYRPSASYTATLTNVPAPTTTTTTLPGESCTPGACIDDDPCTVDSCVAGGCQHVPATGVDAVRCRLAKLSAALDDVRPTTRVGHRVVEKLFKAINTVEPALDAIASGAPNASRLLKRTERKMNQFSTIVDRGVFLKVIDGDDGDTLRTLAGDAYDQIVLLSP
jgi:hypothetical protein